MVSKLEKALSKQQKHKKQQNAHEKVQIYKYIVNMLPRLDSYNVLGVS